MQMQRISEVDKEIAEVFVKEMERQQDFIELIASENYTSAAVMEAQGSILTNKYAEGYPGKRYYDGCGFVDIAESLAIERVKKIFSVDCANVQPHSGSQANMGAYFAFLKPGDRIMGMDIDHGGHLTHGFRVNFSGKIYENHSYGVDKDTEIIDFNVVRDTALKVKPKMIVVGASAYPREIDFKAFSEIAKEVGAFLMADIAHIAGLVAAKLHPDPVPYCDVITTTTHKTLRGPRGGVVMCKEDHAKKINSAVFPGMQGGPLMHVIAAKAVAFKEALTQEFTDYQKQVVANAAKMADEFMNKGYRLVTGGTDNHLMLIDVRSQDISGQEASDALHKAGITVNKNLIPFDPAPPTKASGIRIGTPAMTTRGMKENEMLEIVDIIDSAFKVAKDESALEKLKNRSIELCKKFPIYSQMQEEYNSTYSVS
ncbi:MAG: serine hydroxymethyltransferase [Planctomycetota bacterium]|jgi:glycine hydroxymethyltransferase